MPDAPPPQPRAPVPTTWTLSQRKGLLVLLTVLLAYLTYTAARNRAYVANPQPPAGARAADLADRIDPNTADLATLNALPGLGEKRAAALIAFRDGRPAPAFTRPEDLLKVTGFGAATVDALRPHLVFPSTRPAE